MRQLPAWLVLGLLGCGGDRAPGGDAIPSAAPWRPSGEASVRYTLSFPDAARHRVRVVAEVDEGVVDWWMPVWTPGSYLLREYSRHVVDVVATRPDGTTVAVDKVEKNRWQVRGETGPLRLSWEVYARELSVRTSFVDDDVAVLVPASLLLVPDGATGEISVGFEPPEGWEPFRAPLPEGPDGRFVARDVDHLIDSPIVGGRAGFVGERAFEVDGLPHRVVHVGHVRHWDLDAPMADVARLFETQAQFWGGLPYARYDVLNVILPPGRGGLEHLESTLVMADADALVTAEGRKRWLRLLSHELFHTWNGKRLRPAGFGPFDYEAERYTRSLWVVEGVTSYYDDLLARRAELVDDADVLRSLSLAIATVQRSPGSAVRSVEHASFDAWIRFYRPDEDSVNTDVSYYQKGAVLAWLLDVEIRRRTGGSRSLDDVMRLMYARFGDADQGYPREAMEDAVAEVLGDGLPDFFDAYVRGTTALDYEPALTWLGLRFAEADASDDPQSAFHLDLSWGALPTITKVRRGSPAWEAGLQVGDELVFMDGRRVTDAVLLAFEHRLAPGEAVPVVVSRRGERVERMLVPEAPRATSWTLELDPRANLGAQRRRRAWLTGAPR